MARLLFKWHDLWKAERKRERKEKVVTWGLAIDPYGCPISKQMDGQLSFPGVVLFFLVVFETFCWPLLQRRGLFGALDGSGWLFRRPCVGARPTRTEAGAT